MQTASEIKSNKCPIFFTHVSVFSLALGANTLDQVEQQLTGHGLYAAGQRLVMHVLGEEVDRQRQVC